MLRWVFFISLGYVIVLDKQQQFDTSKIYNASLEKSISCAEKLFFFVSKTDILLIFNAGYKQQTLFILCMVSKENTFCIVIWLQTQIKKFNI